VAGDAARHLGRPGALQGRTGPLPGRYFAGDGAKLDDDGYLWLLGRVDDVMNVSGHRISTTEVESALVDHPAVAEAAVVGRNDPITGQAIFAYVILRSDVIEVTDEPSARSCASTWPRRSARSPSPSTSLHARPAQDPLGQDHAPPAARRRRGSRRWATRPRSPTPASSSDPLASLRSTFGTTAPSTNPDMSAPADAPALARRERTAPPTPAEPPAPSAFTDDLPRRHTPAASVAPSDHVAPTWSAAPAPLTPAAVLPSPPVMQAPPPPAAPAPVPSRATDDEHDQHGASARPYVSAQRSVFDDVVSPSPALPPTVTSEPTRPVADSALAPEALVGPPAVPVAQPTPVLAPVAPLAPVGQPMLPTDQAAGPVPGAPILPTLPAVVPTAPPPVALMPEPDTSQADIRALRSAQLRAGRQRRTGKVIGRTILIVLVLGGLVAAALTFGRSYLFPVEWDPCAHRARR
jgi:hypothetical protein